AENDRALELLGLEAGRPRTVPGDVELGLLRVAVFEDEAVLGVALEHAGDEGEALDRGGTWDGGLGRSLEHAVLEVSRDPWTALPVARAAPIRVGAPADGLHGHVGACGGNHFGVAVVEATGAAVSLAVEHHVHRLRLGALCDARGVDDAIGDIGSSN